MPPETTFEWTCGELAEGLRCYDAGEFFLAHEHWEIVWLRLQEPEKTFLQALIQTAAAFHHFQRSNLTGTASLLKTALGRLNKYPALFGGVRVAPLRDEIGLWLGWLEACDASSAAMQSRPAFPAIKID